MQGSLGLGRTTSITFRLHFIRSMCRKTSFSSSWSTDLKASDLILQQFHVRPKEKKVVTLNLDLLQKEAVRTSVTLFVARGTVHLFSQETKKLLCEFHPFYVISPSQSGWGETPSPAPFKGTTSFSWIAEQEDGQWTTLLRLNRKKRRRLTFLLGSAFLPWGDFHYVSFFAWMTLSSVPTEKWELPSSWVRKRRTLAYQDRGEIKFSGVGHWILMLSSLAVSDGGMQVRISHIAWCVGKNLYFSKLGTQFFAFTSFTELRKLYPESDCFQILSFQ